MTLPIRAATDYVISHYFRDPSYLCIDGAPYFSIYLLGQMIDRMAASRLPGPPLIVFRQRHRAPVSATYI